MYFVNHFMKKIKQAYVIGFILLAVIGSVFLITNSDKITKTITSSIQKNDCDTRFLKWCEPNPIGVDYDNFANENRDCKDRGSYRTCQQVSEALS